MEIGRSPLLPGARQANATYTGATRATASEAAPAPARAQVRRGEQPEAVLQGQLLERDRSPHYQSTRAFLDERAFDRALADNPPSPPVRAALSRYLTAAAPDEGGAATPAPGHQVSYFV